MKKVLSYILISLIISANLFAPFSVGWGENSLEINKKVAHAQPQTVWDATIPAYQSAFDSSSIKQSQSIYIDPNQAGVGFTVVVDTGVAKNLPSVNNWLHVKAQAGTTSVGTDFNKTNTFILKIVEAGTNQTGYIDLTDYLLGGELMHKRWIDPTLPGMVNSITIDNYFTKITPSGTNGLSVFKSGTNYNVTLYYYSNVLYDYDTPQTGAEIIPGLEANGQSYFPIATKITILTPTAQNPVTGNIDPNGKTVVAGSTGSTLPACSINPASNGTFMGCVVQTFYYVLFIPTSYLFALAGTMFDYTFSFSVQDSSYRSAFVVQGWGLVRDFCNLFFIFIMLYIAIGTILNLSSVKTKETIINVVIIGLFINFSLFATQLIIDASNITARVFYNSNAIKITKQDASGVTNATPLLAVGADGTLPLSAALVSKVNPQNIIMNSDKINSIKNNTGSSIVEDSSSKTLSIGQFILVIIMASAVNIVGLTVFITIAFLFIARVIGLWLAMILAPLAFFTYILPEMSSVKMIGWKNWWPDTLKMAFLAPVFIFFMYLILKFLQADLISDIASKSLSGDGLGYFVAILVPFAFIMIFMMKAKKIAVDMSGEFGETVTKIGSAASGMVLGGAVGMGAMAMRGTVGRLGSAVANSERVKKWESKGYLGASTLRNIGTKAGTGSFDARNTKLGGMAGSGMGVDMGKGKEGGFTKARADKTVARQKRAKELELGPDSPEAIALRAKQVALKKLENEKSHQINSIDGQLTSARVDADDINKRLNAMPEGTDDEKIAKANVRKKANEANEKVRMLNADKSNITNGGLVMRKNANDEIEHDADGNGIPDGSGKYHTDNELISKTGLDKDVKDKNETADMHEALALASGTTASDAINNITTITTTAATTRTAAEIQAATDEATAIANAESAKISAITKAQKAVTAAVTAAATADIALKNNDTQENRDAATATRTASNNANNNLQTITTNAETTRNTAIANAGTTKATAIAQAATDEATAIANAEEIKDNAIAKATTDEATATASRTTANAAITNRDTLVASGQTGKSINNIKLKDIPDAEHHNATINNERKSDFADFIQSDRNKVTNFFSSGGVHSSHGADEASDNIRRDLEVKSSGGGGSHATPTPVAHTPRPTPAGGGHGATATTPAPAGGAQAPHP